MLHTSWLQRLPTYQVQLLSCPFLLYWFQSGDHLVSRLVTTGDTALYTYFSNWLQSTDWYWLHSLVHLLQQLGTECTGWYWLHSLLQQLLTECTDWYWLHSLVRLLQQLATECTGWYWLHSLLQQLLTECTDWYWLHSLVRLLQQLATECTGWYSLHSLVHFLQQLVASTYRLQSILTGCWRHSPYCTVLHPNWLQKTKTKKGEKLAKYRPVDVKIHW